MHKIKKGDTVVLIAGKDKGQRGAVLAVKMDKNRKPIKVLVEGLNYVHKHVKANPQAQTEGSITKQEAFLAISNVAIYNAVTEKADRVGIKILEGKRVRYYKSNNEIIDVVS